MRPKREAADEAVQRCILNEVDTPTSSVPLAQLQRQDIKHVGPATRRYRHYGHMASRLYSPLSCQPLGAMVPINASKPLIALRAIFSCRQASAIFGFRHLWSAISRSATSGCHHRHQAYLAATRPRQGGARLSMLTMREWRLPVASGN